jgi:hypothetical protein
LKRYKSPGSDQIPAEPIQARGETLRSIIVTIYNKRHKTDCSGQGPVEDSCEHGNETSGSIKCQKVF